MLKCSWVIHSIFTKGQAVCEVSKVQQSWTSFLPSRSLHSRGVRHLPSAHTEISKKTTDCDQCSEGINRNKRGRHWAKTLEGGWLESFSLWTWHRSQVLKDEKRSKMEMLANIQGRRISSNNDPTMGINRICLKNQRGSIWLEHRTDHTWSWIACATWRK